MEEYLLLLAEEHHKSILHISTPNDSLRAAENDPTVQNPVEYPKTGIV